ncbi:Fur family transcriptional regulator [Mycobacterium tilburgii]|uniref:Fur family transcriptional regulator n=1 Tax=Mycobacterium tilburgii TaxID=44467 RepID=UPI0021B4BF05|nr:Fur family transcriptional regulator [Mycobacterium tilburgii]
MTVQQRAVLDLLQRGDRFRSAQQLHFELRQHDGVRIGLVTVYRILHAFAGLGIAETQRSEEGEMLYRLRTTPEHRHYLLCRQCGLAIAFTVDDVECLTSELAQHHRFIEVAHQIDLYGTCPHCVES